MKEVIIWSAAGFVAIVGSSLIGNYVGIKLGNAIVDKMMEAK